MPNCPLCGSQLGQMMQAMGGNQAPRNDDPLANIPDTPRYNMQQLRANPGALLGGGGMGILGNLQSLMQPQPRLAPQGGEAYYRALFGM